MLPQQMEVEDIQKICSQIVNNVIDNIPMADSGESSSKESIIDANTPLLDQSTQVILLISRTCTLHAVCHILLPSNFGIFCLPLV